MQENFTLIQFIFMEVIKDLYNNPDILMLPVTDIIHVRTEIERHRRFLEVIENDRRRLHRKYILQKMKNSNNNNKVWKNQNTDRK